MIREPYDLSAEEREAHERKWGKYNDYPPGWTEISADEYSDSGNFTWTPMLYEFRQMYNREGPAPRGMPDFAVSARLEFQPDNQTGFAAVSFYWEKAPGKKLRFFRFGCNHPHHGANHVKCPECGFHPHYDSSD